MASVALLVRLEAKPGKEAEVESFLRGGLSVVQQEPATTAWFAIRLGGSTFGIFDTFPDEAGRQAHLTGDVKASQVLYDEIAKAGGKPLMFKTGHSLIKAKMAEISSPFAGEMSGHIFYADHWYGFDDALYVAVRLLGIVARMPGKLSDVRKAMPQVVNTPELRFDCLDTRKFAVIEEVAGRLRGDGCCARATRRPCWSPAPRRATRPGWTGSRGRSRISSKPRASRRPTSRGRTPGTRARWVRLRSPLLL